MFQPILEAQSTHRGEHRHLFLASIAMFLAGILLGIGVSFGLAELLDPVGSPAGQKEGANFVNTMDVNVQGVWGKKGFPVKDETLRAWRGVPYLSEPTQPLTFTIRRD